LKTNSLFVLAYFTTGFVKEDMRWSTEND